MNLIRKAAVLTAAVSVTLSCLSAECFAAGTTATGYITGEFRYLPADAANCVIENFYYSDDYFSEPGSAVNPHLRTMSFDLALTAFGSDYGSRTWENTGKLFEDIGFDTGDIFAADMDRSPTQDTLGTVMCHKKTIYGEVIAVAVRGSNYELEWLNNFTPGDGGDAEGFSAAADLLIDRIRAYEIMNGLNGAKLWIAGYSRGGGVAGLAGKYINEHTDEFGITADDLYVYTFEAPAGSSTYTQYANIHDVINPNDVIPLVYPECWGLYHTGVAEMLECEEIPLTLKELGISFNEGFQVYDKKDYVFDEKTWKLKETLTYDPVNMSDFLREYIGWLAARLDRKTFSENSGYIRDLLSITITRRLSGKTALTNYLKEAFSAAFSTENIQKVMPLFYSKPGTAEHEKALNALTALMEGKMTSKDPEDALAAEELSKIRDALPHLLKMFAGPVSDDVDGTHILGYGCTFFSYSEQIAMQHTDRVVLRLVEAKDSFHNGTEKIPEFTTTAATTTTVTTTTTTAATTTTTTAAATTSATTAATTTTAEIIPVAGESAVSTDTTTAAEITTTVTEKTDETSGNEDIPLWVIILGACGGVVAVGIIAGVIIYAVGRKKTG